MAFTWPAARCSCCANARVLGHVFNPLTVYWCHDAGAALAAVGGRSAQHLRRAARLPAASRRPRAVPGPAKDFYVSPFLPVAGTVPDAAARGPAGTLRLAISLDIDGQARCSPPPSAGCAVAYSAWRLISHVGPAPVGHRPGERAASAGRRSGWLARRQRIIPRPVHSPQKGVQ